MIIFMCNNVQEIYEGDLLGQRWVFIYCLRTETYHQV